MTLYHRHSIPPSKQPTLKPMLDASQFNLPGNGSPRRIPATWDASVMVEENAPCVITIHDPNHFTRTVRFAQDNDLMEDFGKRLANLLQLLMLRPEARIYPDAPDHPSFGWQGAGMVGGFIFHAVRDPDDDKRIIGGSWCIHT